MRLDPALNFIAISSVAMARLVSAPVRTALPRRSTGPVSDHAFKCPSCRYELRVAPRSATYACPRCAVALGPRRLRRSPSEKSKS